MGVGPTNCWRPKSNGCLTTKKDGLEHPGQLGVSKDEGGAAGRHRIARIMRDNGWRAEAATNSKHSLPVAPNLLGQDFNVDRPGQKWASDTSAPTYIWTEAGCAWRPCLNFTHGG